MGGSPPDCGPVVYKVGSHIDEHRKIFMVGIQGPWIQSVEEACRTDLDNMVHAVISAIFIKQAVGSLKKLTYGGGNISFFICVQQQPHEKANLHGPIQGAHQGSLLASQQSGWQQCSYASCLRTVHEIVVVFQRRGCPQLFWDQC